jgi:hypothetical protein
MIRWVSQLTANRMLICLVLIALLAACQFLPLSQPTPAPTAAPPEPTLEEAALPTTVPGEEGPTSTPAPPPESAAPGFAPGTIIAEESSTLNAQAGGEFEMTFESGALQVMRLDATVVGGSLEYELLLFDKFGNILATLQSTVGRTEETLMEFTLPYEGEYLIVVSPIEGEGTLQVVVTALGPPSGGGMLDGVDSAVNGMMSSARVYHTYQFPLTEGEVVKIGAVANVAGAPDTRLVLYGPDGRYITEIDDVDPFNDIRDAVLTGFVAPETGTYTAVVTNYGESIGAYIFSVLSATKPPEAEGEPDLVYDRDYRAAFFEGSTLSATFDGYTGEVLQVSVFDPGPDLDIDVYIYSPFEQIIAYARDARPGEGETLHEMQLPYDGRYRLELRPIGVGEASFRITRLPAEELSGGGLFGDEVSKALFGYFRQLNVFHIYQFNAQKDDRVSLIVTSESEEGTLDIGFTVLGPNGLQLASADRSEGENPEDPALVQYVITQTGTYTVVVYTINDATGYYEIRYSRE